MFFSFLLFVLQVCFSYCTVICIPVMYITVNVISDVLTFLFAHLILFCLIRNIACKITCNNNKLNACTFSVAAHITSHYKSFLRLGKTFLSTESVDDMVWIP